MPKHNDYIALTVKFEKFPSITDIKQCISILEKAKSKEQTKGFGWRIGTMLILLSSLGTTLGVLFSNRTNAKNQFENAKNQFNKLLANWEVAKNNWTSNYENWKIDHSVWDAHRINWENELTEWTQQVTNWKSQKLDYLYDEYNKAIDLFNSYCDDFAQLPIPGHENHYHPIPYTCREVALSYTSTPDCNTIFHEPMCNQLKKNLCETFSLADNLHEQIDHLLDYSLEQISSIANITKPFFNESEPQEPTPFSLREPSLSNENSSSEMGYYITLGLVALISMTLIYSLFKYIRNDKKYQLSNRLTVEELDQVSDVCDRLSIKNINSITRMRVNDILPRLETEYEKAEKRYLLLSATLEKNNGSVLHGFFNEKDTARDISRKIFTYADIMPSSSYKLKK